MNKIWQAGKSIIWAPSIRGAQNLEIVVVQKFVGFSYVIALLQGEQNQRIALIPYIQLPVAGQLEKLVGFVSVKAHAERYGNQLVP